MTDMDDILKHLPPSPYSLGDYYGLIIPDEIGKLKRVLQVIEQWERISDEELKKLQSESEKEHNELAEQYGYDPVNDEAFMLHQTARVMYANLAVTVATSAEVFVDCFCKAKGLTYLNKSGKPIDRPNWGHKKSVLERSLSVKFEDINGFAVNRKARVMGNCFKHNEGQANEEYVNRYGGESGAELEYDNEDWSDIIDGTRTFLLNLAGKL